MGYMHIENLYRVPQILDYPGLWALEKIHGTSAHIRWSEDSISFFSGGEKHDNFVALFNRPGLVERFQVMGYPTVVIYGEAYGGKQQGMRATYGDHLKFIAFDVKIGGHWVDVPIAAEIVRILGLEFVAHQWVEPPTLERLTELRNLSSPQAVRNGILEPREQEGIVLRPLIEQTWPNGSRVIAKYKNDSFMENAKARRVKDPPPDLLGAQAIANDWVTETRLAHVLDHLAAAHLDVSDIKSTGAVIHAMCEDVSRESSGEFKWSDEIRRAVSRETAKLFRAYLTARTFEIQ